MRRWTGARATAPARPGLRRHRGRPAVGGPVTLSARGTDDDDGPAFVEQDRNYVSARWPGDAYLFARRFLELLEGSRPRREPATYQVSSDTPVAAYMAAAMPKLS